MSCIIVVGGEGESNFGVSNVEVLNGNLGSIKLPNLPKEIDSSSLVLHDRNILISGGRKNLQKCLELRHGNWVEHSTLNEPRLDHSAVTTPTATFLFGGHESKTTYEYLPKDSTTWHKGKTAIPINFVTGCAIDGKSNREVLLIGTSSFLNEHRILSFNVKNHTFNEMPFGLNVGRFCHTCAFIPNTNKIMIAGGYKSFSNVETKLFEELDSTEILDVENGTVTMASPMNSKRASHGTGILTINGEDRLVVFGGSCDKMKLDSIEIYNTETEKWEIADFKLKFPRNDFSAMTVKLSDVISYL